MDITHNGKPRCYLLHALAPLDMAFSTVIQTINRICGDLQLPLALYHDHFTGGEGGIILFYAETADEREALQTHLELHLVGWEYTLHPLVFSYSPAAFDEQIAFTLRAYRNSSWERLQNINRPIFSLNPFAP